VAGKILEPCEETVKAVSSILIAGGMVVYPSDTVYGILADACSVEACLRLAVLKGYKTHRPFIVLVQNMDEALSLTVKKSALVSMENYWPGPVTLVLPASHDAPQWLIGPEGGIALRVPADPFSQAILEETSMKLVSTSANLSGGSNPLDLSMVPESILEAAEAAVDGGQLKGMKPSRVIDLTGDEPKILR